MRRTQERRRIEIDQALADSFPASDAPPWTLGREVGSLKGYSKAKETARLNSIAKIDCVHSVRDEQRGDGR